MLNEIISYCNTFLFVERDALSSKKNKSWHVALAFVSSSVKFKDIQNLYMVFSFSPSYISIPIPDLHLHSKT